MRKSFKIIGFFLIIGFLLVTNSTAFAGIDAPKLVFPEDNSAINDNTPEFRWENLENAENYRLVINDDPSFVDENYYDVSGILENSLGIPSDNSLEDGIWYWKVRGENGDNVGDWSNIKNFLVDTKAPPSPSSSENNEMVTNDNTPTLTWESVEDVSGPETEDVAGIENYELWLDNDDNFSSTWRKYSPSQNSLEIPEELPEGKYYYKVKTWDEAGNGSHFSEVWTFNVDVTPPEISSREVIVRENSATINWVTNEPSDSFVEYGTDENFGENKLNSDMVTEHSITIKNLSENTTYYFKIKSIDKANNSIVSQENTFQTLLLMDPISTIDNIAKYWYNTENVKITASAHDNDGYVTNVQLYFRHRERENSNWDQWSFYATDNDSPWSWNFDAPSGDGHYEFYTRAIDNDDQTENLPDIADERIGFDTTPPDLSRFQINGENTVTDSPVVRITISASDELSGLDTMRFKYEQQPWREWENFQNERNFKLTFPNGEKRISLQTKDLAGNESEILENEILLENATFSEKLGSIMKGEEKIADFTEWNLPIESVGLRPRKGIENAYVSLRVQKEEPLKIPDRIPSNIINYFELKTNVSKEDIEEIVIIIRVKKSWLREKGFEREDVKLWKFKKDKKVLLPVYIDSVHEDYVKYSASVSNLSWFAISAYEVKGELVFWSVPSLIILLIISIVIILSRVWKPMGSDRGLP